MVNQYILFGLYVLSFVFVLLGIIFLKRLKDYENNRLEDGYNALLFGLFCFLLFLLVKVLIYVNRLFLESVSLGQYFNLLNSLGFLVFIPLMSVCFVVALILFTDI